MSEVSLYPCKVYLFGVIDANEQWEREIFVDNLLVRIHVISR